MLRGLASATGSGWSAEELPTIRSLIQSHHAISAVNLMVDKLSGLTDPNHCRIVFHLTDSGPCPDRGPSPSKAVNMDLDEHPVDGKLNNKRSSNAAGKQPTQPTK
jgi:hypothetical protein